MSKQTLQQKIQRALARFTPRRIAIIMLGTAILSFGIHNIHQRTAITEGGMWPPLYAPASHILPGSPSPASAARGWRPR